MQKNKKLFDDVFGIIIAVAIIFGLGSCQTGIFGHKRMEWWQGGLETLFAFGMCFSTILISFFTGRLVYQHLEGEGRLIIGVIVGLLVFLLCAIATNYIPRPYMR